MNGREAGFTLVEMMMALFIFALLAAAGVGLLAFSVRAQAAAAERLDGAAALRRAAALMTADLALATPRLTRDRLGARRVAFVGGTGDPGETALDFVRRGWGNPDGAPRASLQRVSYRLSGDRLERIAWPMLDGAAPAAPTTVLAGVRSLRLRYRDQGEWRDRWDPLRATALPQAVEAVVDVADVGSVRQLFLTGSGG